MDKIFFDNNATTPIDPRVVQAIEEEWQKGPSNPSSVHSFGQEAKKRLNKARDTLAQTLRVSPTEIVFTSGGTEGLNLMIFSLPQDRPVLTSPIEHAAVYETIRALPHPPIYLPIDATGAVSLAEVEAALSQVKVAAIVLSAVNSETGVKNPIEAIAQIAHAKGIPFLVDGVCSLGKEEVSLPKGVSAIAFSGHKFHGPQGTGFVVARPSFPLQPRLLGGGQERLRRSGTENLPGIIGLAKAVELLQTELPTSIMHMRALRNAFETGLKQIAPAIQINGEKGVRIANTSSITFPGVDGEGLLIELDLKGVAASMGSACSSGAVEPSRVLMYMGLSREEALSSLRFSFSRLNTHAEVKQALAILKPILA